MRYQALPAAQPDGLYALWDGEPYRAKTSTSDRSVLLIARDGQAPEGFDREYEGHPAAVVADTDVPHTFTIHTRCRYADENFALIGQPDTEQLMLAWTGRDPEVARQLGLIEARGRGGFGAAATPEHIEALWQERHDFVDKAAPSGATATDAKGLLRGIGRTLREIRPEGCTGVAAQFRQVGGYSELEVRGVVGDISYSLAAPPKLGQLFSELRAAMYEPGKGTWFKGTFTLTGDGHFDFDYDMSSQPQWRLAPDADRRPTARAFAAELERFPREKAYVPPWLGARAGLPLDVEFRHARVVDQHTPGERPVVDRPPVPPEELRGVLAYLYRSPVVMAGDGPQPDLFAPHAAPSVPHAFHTDGTWIWPAAVPHYLRLHGIAPDEGLLEHIRANAYRRPFVSQRLLETARAELAGEPFPPQSPDDLDEHDAVTEVERDDSVLPRLRASEVLTILRKRLAELGVSSEAYRLGGAAGDVWCLLRVDEGWQVARYDGGRPVQAEHFSGIGAAAAHLLGVLAFHPTRSMAPPEEDEAPTDWPILPLQGEPPLTMFRGKRMVTLPAGIELVRFGREGGNLMHEAKVSFRETSLLPDREALRAGYRLRRPLRVLTGVTLPFGGMPGGALAYLLPRPVGLHVETGALEPVAAKDS